MDINKKILISGGLTLLLGGAAALMYFFDNAKTVD